MMRPACEILVSLQVRSDDIFHAASGLLTACEVRGKGVLEMAALDMSVNSRSNKRPTHGIEVDGTTVKDRVKVFSWRSDVRALEETSARVALKVWFLALALLCVMPAIGHM